MWLQLLGHKVELSRKSKWFLFTMFQLSKGVLPKKKKKFKGDFYNNSLINIKYN